MSVWMILYYKEMFEKSEEFQIILLIKHIGEHTHSIYTYGNLISKGKQNVCQCWPIGKSAKGLRNRYV
jgi:hypothetical protein